MMKKLIEQLEAKCQQLEAENTRLRREKDAAVAAMDLVAEGTVCTVCKHLAGDGTICSENTLCNGCDMFEWCGVEEDEEDG